MRGSATSQSDEFRAAILDEYFGDTPNVRLHTGSDTWGDLQWIMQQTLLPVILKGIVSADEARRAVEIGAAGIVVSNHGGR